MSGDSGSFTYSSQPHSAPIKATKKYRDNPHVPDEAHLTLMSDPRVIRGSTFSMARKIAKAKTEFSKSMSMAQKQMLRNESDQPMSQPMYRYEVKQFNNDEIDINQFLTEKNDLPVLKATKDNQTDEFVPRPLSPDYIPAKIGVDIGTQVDDVSELFDFDKEVEPILEVIVRKTIEQSLFEVDSEEELSSLEQAAKHFRAEKFKEEEWVKQREEQAIKDHATTRNHILALQQAREAEMRTKTAVAGVQMMKQILPHAFDTIASTNLANGTWQTSEAATAEEVIIPSLLADASTRACAHAAAQDVIDDMLFAAEARYQTFPTYIEPSSRNAPTLTVTFKAAAPEEEDETATRTSSGPFTSLTVQIGPSDSIQTVEKTIRASVAKLKASASEASDETAGEESAAPPTQQPMILPDTSGLANLRSLLTERIVSMQPSYPCDVLREIPIDAILYNFTLPPQIDIEMIVG